MTAPTRIDSSSGKRHRSVGPISPSEVKEHHEDDNSRSEDTHKARQQRQGKQTARQRLTSLLDTDSFTELWSMQSPAGAANNTIGDGDGVVTGYGTVHNRQVMVFAQDFAIRGGSLGQTHAEKIVKLLRLAERSNCPVVGLYDGGGARIQEGVAALNGCGELFHEIVRLSGIIPQISAVMGPCAGAAAYAPALTDVVFMVQDIGMMYLTGPDVVEKVTGERTTGDALGGVEVHATSSGVATFAHTSEAACLEDIRYLVSLLPSSFAAAPERLDTGDPANRSIEEILDLVPANAKATYDINLVIDTVLDRDTFIEFHARWAKNIVCGLGRIDSHVVGVVANQPAVLAGVLDSDASQKAARFVSWCDAMSIPLVTLVDVPGFMPGTDVERGGVIRHGAKLLHAYCAATVPRVQVILRKAYGGAYIVMDSPATGSDISYAWPTNEVGVMGADAAVEIIHRRELAAAASPSEERTRLREEYEQRYLHPYAAAHEGLVHEIIDPTDTRRRLAQTLDLLLSDRDQRSPRSASHIHKKRGNIPL